MANITPMQPPTGLNSDFTDINPLSGEESPEDDSPQADWVCTLGLTQDEPASGVFYGGDEDLPTTTGTQVEVTGVDDIDVDLDDLS